VIEQTHRAQEHYHLLAVAIGASVLGVVLWGTIIGAMLPFVLKKCRLDPATSSAPFVATLVDVVGVLIYLSAAAVILRGTLL
jgi:magnesium transporter